MNEKQILKYAYEGALARWSMEYERLQRNPENSITKAKEARLNKDFNEIREKLMALEG